ncbi:hypothetical protein ACFY2R_05255 [Micromonospora olivasterospora]|uniref:Uncharacterized protein n=1 Tax=Micromonospora olivasterospora TaxID=1880 RepID=A0A562I9A0_MICOL|nr:hypothetical protein [Micromonospora olivasterospora]TWH67305.1 hypothetical protein JD77_02279 [Micromonospora olivasterospora]
MSEHPPKRTRRPWSTSPDVFHSNGRDGFTGDAKGGRTRGVSEHRPYPTPRPANRKDTH